MATPERFVSSGDLPGRARVQQVVDHAHTLFAPERGGSLSTVYPALAGADPEAFGLAVVSATGDASWPVTREVPFTIMSVAKPFVFALVGEQVGVEQVRRRVGVNATGMAFNSAYAIERDPPAAPTRWSTRARSPPPACAPGRDLEDRWSRLHEGLSRFAGHALPMDEATLESARATNHRNRGLANMMTSLGTLGGDPADAVDLYTRQSCLAVTARGSRRHGRDPRRRRHQPAHPRAASSTRRPPMPRSR